MASAPTQPGQQPEGFEHRPSPQQGFEWRTPLPAVPEPLPARRAEVVRAPLVEAPAVPLPPRSAELVRRPVTLPAVRAGRRRRRWPAVLVVLACGGLALGAALRVGPLAAPAPTTSENRLIADALQGRADSAAALQLTGYLHLRDAMGSLSAVTAAREAMLIAAVLTVLLTGALARRFGLSLPATALAGVATAALPLALAAHRLVAPVNLALPWLLAAALFASANARRRLAAAPAVLCLLAAVATAPLLAAVALATVAVLLAGRDIGVRWGLLRRTVLAGVLLLGAVVTLALVAGIGVGAPRWLAQPLAVPKPGLVDLVALGVVGVGAAFALVVRWLRPFALVLLGCLSAAFAGPDGAPLLLMALPAGAMLLGAAVDAGTERSGTRKHVRRLIPLGARSVVLALVVLLAGLGLALTAPAASGSGVSDPERAVAWAHAEAGGGGSLVDDAVWTAAGSPDGMLRYRDAGRLPTSTVFMIGRSPEKPDVAALSAWHRSLKLASFGATEVRLLVPSLPTYARNFATDQQARRTAEAALRTTAPRLTLAPQAAVSLARGDVDARLVTVLASLSAGHQVTLAELPAVPGETGPYSLRRRARITGFDGAAVTRGTAAAQTLRQWLTAQVPPYQPAMSLGPDGLILHYSAPSPLGLLSP